MVVRLMSGQAMTMSFLDSLPGVVVGFNQYAKYILPESKTVEIPGQAGNDEKRIENLLFFCLILQLSASNLAK